MGKFFSGLNTKGNLWFLSAVDGTTWHLDAGREIFFQVVSKSSLFDMVKGNF